MIHAIEFIETSVFTRQIQRLASDEELRCLQNQLIARPNIGALIVGTGGLRKVRMPLFNRGKSASLRVIYFLAHSERIYLMLAYPKNVKDNLTDEEKRTLKGLVKKIKQERS